MSIHNTLIAPTVSEFSAEVIKLLEMETTITSSEQQQQQPFSNEGLPSRTRNIRGVQKSTEGPCGKNITDAPYINNNSSSLTLFMFYFFVLSPPPKKKITADGENQTVLSTDSYTQQRGFCHFLMSMNLK